VQGNELMAPSPREKHRSVLKSRKEAGEKTPPYLNEARGERLTPHSSGEKKKHPVPARNADKEKKKKKGGVERCNEWRPSKGTVANGSW